MKSRKPVKKRPQKPNAQWADHYTNKAKQDNYPARSVYKLKEIQQKFTIIKKGDKVLDLGCAPGSWLLFATEQAGSAGQVIGIDLKPVDIPLPENAETYEGDLLNLSEALSNQIGTQYNAVLSDMAPATTGNKAVDSARSFALCMMALSVAKKRLLPGGQFVCKLFQGAEFEQFKRIAAGGFEALKIFKPESCRKQSKEIYIIGKGKKQEETWPDIVNGQT